MARFQGTPVEKKSRFSGQSINQATSLPKEEPEAIPEKDIGTDRKLRMPPERKEVGGSVMQKMGGLGEAGLSMGTGAAAEVGAGFRGLYELGQSYMAGEDDPLSQSADAIESFRDAYTYEPKTERGKNILYNLTQDEAMKDLMEKSEKAGEATLKKTGSPGAATAVKTGIEFLPAILGGEARFATRPVKGRVEPGREEADVTPSQEGKPDTEVVEKPAGKVRKEDYKRITKILGERGIDYRSGKSLIESLKQIGEDIQSPGFGEAVERVQSAVVKKRKAEKDIENDLWATARSGKEGYVGKQQVQGFRDHLNNALDDFIPEDMPKVNKLMKRLDKVDNLPENSSARISELYKWRKSINANMPANKKEPEAAALIAMKNNFDNFINNQFMTDMIKGDASSVARWREAINKTSEIKDTFDSDKAIKSFAKQDATPDELRKFLFNASGVGMPAGAARTARKLKRILGADSKEFTALRQEAMFNVVEPLLNETPNFSQFRTNYNKFVKKNKKLIDEIFPKESMQALDTMYASAKSAATRLKQREQTGQDISLPRLLGTFFFGHGIAQAGLRVRIARDAIEGMMQSGNTPVKKEIMRETLGYDPTTSAFREPLKRSATIAAGQQALEEKQDEPLEQPSGPEALMGEQ